MSSHSKRYSAKGISEASSPTSCGGSNSLRMRASSASAFRLFPFSGSPVDTVCFACRSSSARHIRILFLSVGVLVPYYFTSIMFIWHTRTVLHRQKYDTLSAQFFTFYKLFVRKHLIVRISERLGYVLSAVSEVLSLSKYPFVFAHWNIAAESILKFITAEFYLLLLIRLLFCHHLINHLTFKHALLRQLF